MGTYFNLKDYERRVVEGIRDVGVDRYSVGLFYAPLHASVCFGVVG